MTKKSNNTLHLRSWNQQTLPFLLEKWHQLSNLSNYLSYYQLIFFINLQLIAALTKSVAPQLRTICFMYSLPCSGTLVVLWGGKGHSETVDKQTDGQRDSPWHCPQSTVLGNNSPLFMGLWQKRSRLTASIPDTFPLFPPSFLHILHPHPLTIPLSPNSPFPLLSLPP